jgi:hypothetical protein
LPAEAPLGAADIAHDATDVLADPLIEDRLPRYPLEVDAIIDHGEAASRQLGRANMHLPTRGQRRRARDEFLRQPDTANVRTGSVTNLHEVLLVRSIASHGTIAHPVGMAIAARRHGWPGAASAEPSFAPTIRQ